MSTGYPTLTMQSSSSEGAISFDVQACFDVQTYVDQTAALLGLKISPEIRPSVVENFERIMAIAQPVLDFELPDNLEPAPTFDP